MSKGDWREKFKAYSLRTNFHIGLTRPQLEFLCAVADNVEWDRFTHGLGSGPYCAAASSAALEKRGLIERKPHGRDGKWNHVFEIRSLWTLTLAGEILVELLKETGLFIEADNAIVRKAQKNAS